MDSAHKEIDRTTGHYTIVDYIKEEVRNLEPLLEAHRVSHKITDEEFEYLEIEWANCLLRQMLHLYQGIFRASGNRWDLHRAALPISLDGRLVHPEDHYVINANPKEKNPPCPIQLSGMNRVGIMAKAAPRNQPRTQEHGWTGRDRSQWFGLEITWPPQSAPIPWMVREAQKGHGKGTGTRNTCLLCNEPGHNYRQCLWYWAWLLTEDHDHMETSSTVPRGTRDLLNRQRHLEIMELGRSLELQVEQIVPIGLTIVANQNDLGAINRYAERLERHELAQELDHPMGWQHMEIAELRALATQRRNRMDQDRPHRTPKAKAQPKAEAAPGTHSAASIGSASGTHSAENFQQNQALFEQQAFQNQAENQEQQSDKSAETWNENQDAPDWGGNTY